MGKQGSKKIDWRAIGTLAVKYSALAPFDFLSLGPILKLTLELGDEKGELADKVERTSVALKSASLLVNELQAELAEKLENVERLKVEYEKYQELASIEQAKSEPLMRQVQQTISKGQVRERWIAFGINLIAGTLLFFAGIALSPHVIAWFNSL